MRKILLVDDEVNVLNALQRSLKQIFKADELTIEICTDPVEAANRLGMAEYDCVISDFHMPKIDGIDFLRIAKEIQPETVRMMLTASIAPNIVIDAVNEAEVYRYLTKPWDILELKEKIQSAFLYRDKRHLENNGSRGNKISPQEEEKKRLEALEKGITKVNWGSDGSVILE